MYQFWIDTIPVSWSAPIKGKHGFFDKKSKQKDLVRYQLKALYKDKPLSEPVSLEFTFYLPIPKSASKKKKQMMLDNLISPTTPDTTNMQKLYEDCLQNIVIENDRLSNKISSVRYYSNTPGILITVRPWREENQPKKEIYEPRSTQATHQL